MHRRTDPACMLHRTPRTPWGRWWYDRNRGRSCRICMPPSAYLREFILKAAEDFSAAFDRQMVENYYDPELKPIRPVVNPNSGQEVTANG